MRNSWHHFFRRLATGCAVAGGAAWSSALCYAAIAMDNASDPVYVDGWQDGDNGGFGFTAWDFSSSLTFAGTYYGQYSDSSFHAIDDGLRAGTHYSNPFNNIGRAWDIGISPTNNGVPRAGRGFSLGIGETLKVVIDNPTPITNFKGYFVRLNGGTGGVDGNICYGNYACTPPASPVPKMTFSFFKYDNPGNEWSVNDSVGTFTGLTNLDTAAAGALFSVKRTGADTYDVLMDSFGGGTDFMASRTFENPGVPVDWIEFTFFNPPVTDTGTPPTVATDFYIRSIEIVGAAPPGVPGDYNNNGRVDAADYVLWRDKSGQAFQLPNEVSGVTPGSVTPEDYTAWRARFGNTTGTASDVVAAVPEPSALVSLAVGIFGAAAVGVRRSKRTSR